MKTSQRKSQRASAACDFCRRRKLGCDNAKPKCENCQGRAIECTYSQRTAQARPSNARIQKLEEENARLRNQLCSRSPELSSVHSDTQQGGIHMAETPNIVESIPTLNSINDRTLQGKAQAVSPSYHLSTGQPEDAAFHGPSSGPTDLGTAKNSSRMTSSDEITKNQLLAETTRQRQLEKVNLRAGRLDFRGVDPKVGMDLLSKFWNRQHYMGSIVYRPAFMRDMACNGPYYSDLLLAAMLFAGSMHTVDAAALRNTGKLNSVGRPYRIKFEQALHASGSQVLFKSEITTIQALLVVSDALFSWCNERSLSWHYLGIAISMIIDLGLHIDGPARRSSKKVTAEDTEIERRVFWATFISDKVQSIYQGRPTRLREHDNRVSIAFLDEYEELEDFHTRTYSAQPSQLDCPTYSISTFDQLCGLSIIMDRILCALYAERSATGNADPIWHTAQSLNRDLKSWKDGMPECLRVDLNDPTSSNILPHNLSLLVASAFVSQNLSGDFVRTADVVSCAQKDNEDPSCPDIMHQGPDVSVMQQLTPDTAVDFSNLEVSDFDIDQIMQSFVFEAPPMVQEDFVPMPRPGFNHYGTGDEALTSRDVMVFDDLFGFDSSTS
ncbi:Nit-4-like protein [Fusarium denticulatum]|uniref:Nit-4-like protein n=1 Tax=Fusarium denticulatum TaxID=48507 RepID=A0A8H5XG78_9HYPO|nr:Nit-4-like protein [Fusarium denticulatum]